MDVELKCDSLIKMDLEPKSNSGTSIVQLWTQKYRYLLKAVQLGSVGSRI